MKKATRVYYKTAQPRYFPFASHIAVAVAVSRYVAGGVSVHLLLLPGLQGPPFPFTRLSITA